VKDLAKARARERAQFMNRHLLSWRVRHSQTPPSRISTRQAFGASVNHHDCRCRSAVSVEKAEMFYGARLCWLPTMMLS